MAMFHTNVLDNQIKALPTVGTASGSVANFTTDMTENLVEVECEIMYQGTGGGTPTDPNPITVYNELNLSHSGADTSNPTITNIPFGQTVAKGTLNVTSGVIEITHTKQNLNSLNWIKGSRNTANTGYIFRFTFNPREQYSSVVVSGLNNTGDGSIVWESLNLYDFHTVGKSLLLCLDAVDLTDAQTQLANCYIVYKLETPIKVLVVSNTITALLNENNIWCDTNGDTSVKFIMSVGEYVNQNV